MTSGQSVKCSTFNQQMIHREYVHSVAVYKKISIEVGRIDDFRALALLSFIISNTDKNEFSRIWKWISCSNHVDCVIKLDVYLQKMLLCFKNISGL